MTSRTGIGNYSLKNIEFPFETRDRKKVWDENVKREAMKNSLSHGVSLLRKTINSLIIIILWPAADTGPDHAANFYSGDCHKIWIFSRVKMHFFPFMRPPKKTCLLASWISWGKNVRIIWFQWFFTLSAETDLNAHLNIPQQTSEDQKVKKEIEIK